MIWRITRASKRARRDMNVRFAGSVVCLSLFWVSDALVAQEAETQSPTVQQNTGSPSTTLPATSSSEDEATPAGESDPVESIKPATRSDMIVVVGADGTPEYGELFSGWADQLKQVAAASQMEFQSIGHGSPAVTDKSTPDRDLLKQSLDGLPSEGARPVWLVLIGHGTFARGVAKFNLRGRDVSAAELSEWLAPIKRPIAVINCASSSGPFVNRLSAKGRVVVTATKSGMEQNFARFGKYLVEALASSDSDLDHDDEVSVQEAFVRASAEVQRFYDSEQRLATEHALLDDNGDGKGTPAKMFRGTRAIATAKDGSELDGKAASRFTLAPSGKRVQLTEQEWSRRETLEGELEALRLEKTQLDEKVYDQELEGILLQLARIYRAAESRMSDSVEQKTESAEKAR